MPAVAIKSLQAAQDKYKAQGGAAGQYWKDGANAFPGDPTALAAQQGTKAQQAYSLAWTSGRVQRGLAASGKSGWLAGVNDPNAITAYQNGVTGKGATKYGKSMQAWWPVFQGLSDEIAGMPNSTPQDSVNRSARWILGTIAAKQQL